MLFSCVSRVFLKNIREQKLTRLSDKVTSMLFWGNVYGVGNSGSSPVTAVLIDIFMATVDCVVGLLSGSAAWHVCEIPVRKGLHGFGQPHNDGLQPKSDGLQPKSAGLQLKSDGLQPKSDGLQPKSDGLQPKSDGLQAKSAGLQPKSDGLQPESDGLQPKSDGLQPKSDGLQPISHGL